MNSRGFKIAVILLFAIAMVAGTVAFAKGKPAPGDKPCKKSYIQCLDVWDPVVCDNGKTYSNQCYADRACATGCVPAGGGPVPL